MYDVLLCLFSYRTKAWDQVDQKLLSHSRLFSVPSKNRQREWTVVCPFCFAVIETKVDLAEAIAMLERQIANSALQ